MTRQEECEFKLWVARWHCLQFTICCTATAGGSLHRINDILKAIRWRNKNGKNFPKRSAKSATTERQGPCDLCIKDMMTHEYPYVFGAVDVCTGELDSLILPHVNTECMQLFLDEVSARHPDEMIVMVIDSAGWHRSNVLKVPPNIRLLIPPPYAPELNPIEHIWESA